MVSLIIKLVQWRINGLSEHKFIFVAKSTMRREANREARFVEIFFLTIKITLYPDIQQVIEYGELMDFCRSGLGY